MFLSILWRCCTMPHTYNGIGTWYYGKKNEHVREGICEFCNKPSTLKTYDTTKFFVFLYIPVLPLGEKKIIDECSVCRKHRVIKLSEWERMKKEAGEELYNSWIQEPGNVEKAKKLFESIVFYRDVELLKSLEQDIQNYCMNDPQILKFWGETHLFLNQFDEAERAFKASLLIKEDVGVKEELAETLAKNLKPDEAKSYLTHIFDYPDESKLYYIFLLIESYQFIGEHDNALEVINKIEEVYPDIANNIEFKRYKKRTQRHYNSNKRIKGNLISPIQDRKKEGSSNISFILPKVMPLIFITGMILIYTLISYFAGLSRTVYVINGLNTSYSIEVNGEKIKLLPMSTEKIKVPEGTTKVNIVESDIIEGEFEFEINTPFWKRPFIRKLRILNPDKVAVLLREETIYVVDDYRGELPEYDESWYEYYTGRYFYELEPVNFLFEEFPETLELSSKKEKKTRLALMEDFLSLSSYMYVLGSVDHEDALSHIESKLVYNPDNERSLQLLSYYQDEDKYLDFLRSKLDERPVLVNLHICYQDYMESNHPSYNLKEEYTRYLENEKDNNELYYLLSRIEENFQERLSLLERSIEGDNPSAFGYYILGYINFGMGNFEKAYDYVKKAVDIREGQESFNYVMEEIMLSLKMYDDLMERNKVLQGREPYNGSLVLGEVVLHMHKGDVAAAEEAVSNYLERIKDSDSETIRLWDSYLKGVIAYCSGDVHTYASILENMGDDNSVMAFEHAFINGDYDRAADIAINDELGSYYLLLLHLAETDAEKASEYLNYVIEQYKENDILYKKAAECLSGEIEWTMEDIIEIGVYPNEKLLILLALEKQQTPYKEELLELARKLNYRIEFPRHFINSLLNK